MTEERKHCPHAKSDWTPCVLRDGEVCYAVGNGGYPICVGCEKKPHELGLTFPADWGQVAT